MKEINKKMKFIENQREKYHFSMLPIMNNLDDIHRSIFIKFATLSATIGAFSFLLFDNKYSIDIYSLITGDFLLLIVIIISSVLYIFLAEKDHKELLKSYRKTQSFFDDANNGLMDVLKGKVELQEHYKIQIKKLEKEMNLEKEKNNFPNYFWHYVVLVIFCLALIFIGLSLWNIQA